LRLPAGALVVALDNAIITAGTPADATAKVTHLFAGRAGHADQRLTFRMNGLNGAFGNAADESKGSRNSK
jgi:hypothetical protein